MTKKTSCDSDTVFSLSYVTKMKLYRPPPLVPGKLKKISSSSYNQERYGGKRGRQQGGKRRGRPWVQERLCVASGGPRRGRIRKMHQGCKINSRHSLLSYGRNTFIWGSLGPTKKCLRGKAEWDEPAPSSHNLTCSALFLICFCSNTLADLL